MLLALLTSLFLSAEAPALPAGSVVLGKSGVDGTETELWLVTPRGERELLGVMPHAHGQMPRGTVVGHRLFTVAATDDDNGAVLEATELDNGARRVWATDVVTLHAPVVDAQQRVWVLRQLSEGRFQLLRATGPGAATVVVDDIAAAWLTPVRGGGTRWLRLSDRGADIVSLAAGQLRVVQPLGGGGLRAPAQLGDAVVLERALPAGRAQLWSPAQSSPLHEGLAGMDPLSCGDHLWTGTGTKRAGLLQWQLKQGRLVQTQVVDLGRAGVASPLQCTRSVDAGSPKETVVVWLHRGAALPGELWRVENGTASLLWAPAAGEALVVFGVIGATP